MQSNPATKGTEVPMFDLHHHHTNPPNFSTIAPLHPYIPAVDHFLSGICFLCVLLGLPANISTLIYFIRQKKDLPTRLYLVLSLVDILTCFTLIPTGISFAMDRQPVLFGNDLFCQLWGIVWVIVPFLSVYLVCVLSISRTITLLNPLGVVSKDAVTWSIGIYTSYLFLRIMVPIGNDSAHFIYSKSDVYCWEGSQANWYMYYDLATGVLQLAAPILPICISCILSSVSITRSVKLTHNNRSVNNLKLEATITILLVTAVYIVCNIPVFVFWTIYIADGFTVPRDSQFLYWYSWGLTYVVLVGCNAALNPIVMMCRMRRLRQCFKGRRGGAMRLRPLRSMSTSFRDPNIIPAGKGVTCQVYQLSPDSDPGSSDLV